MIQFVIAAALLLQNPSLDSVSPKERMEAVDKLAVVGNREAIPQLAAALKKEPKGDVRAQMIAALGRIGDREAIPILADTMRNDLDKDVRSQAIDSILRLYIPIEDSGPLRTIFNRVKSVFFDADRPMIVSSVAVDPKATTTLSESLQKDFTDQVRVEAARALGSLKAQDQLPSLIATLQDP